VATLDVRTVMRPTPTVPDSDQYECIACGARVEGPDGRACPSCDGNLRDLSLSRDL
jgi:rubrerythrin